MTAPTPPTGPGTGGGGRPGPQACPAVSDPGCGHLNRGECTATCAEVRTYWAGVARGNYHSPNAYLADGNVFTIPPHAPNLAPLTDPALRGMA